MPRLLLLHLRRSPQPYPSIARFIHGRAGAPYGRDRGLDHAVERERHLRPLLALKDLLIRRGSPSLPLSSISAARSRLRLPFRAARFVRAYPSAFQEFTPPSDGGGGGFASLRPHVRPTPDLLRLHEEERGVFAESRGETGDRLLKLLMLTRRKRLPMDALEGLKWDLGLPDDYAQSLLPDYPDYFQVVPSESPDHGPLELELVCWIKDLAVSALEEKSESAALAFPLHFTSGFEPEKKLMRRIEDWQRLPYISPYEDGGARLDPEGDQHEKWAVGVLHEVLHLMVSKKCERWDLLRLGEHLGPKSAVFKRAVASHTGIFYVSHKNRTKVVLLREAYRRDRLLVEHPLVGVRHRYVHLMRKNSGGANDKRKPLRGDSDGGEEEEEERGDLLEDSDDYVDDDEEEEEVEIVGNYEKVNQSDRMDSIRGQLRKSKCTHRSISRGRDIRRKVEH